MILSIKANSGNEICCQALNICRMVSTWRKRTVDLMGQRTVVKMISHWMQQLIVKYCVSFYFNCIAVSKATWWSHAQILVEMRALNNNNYKSSNESSISFMIYCSKEIFQELYEQEDTAVSCVAVAFRKILVKNLSSENIKATISMCLDLLTCLPHCQVFLGLFSMRL